MVSRASGQYLACKNCRRVYTKSELEAERKRRDSKVLTCPYCGSTSFTRKFTNIVLIVDPEKSIIAKELSIIHPGVFAYSLE
ncbi:MAG: transcription elongation factor subunit Spt4 [Candidatus Njordarchaeia archaeon]|nr:DNA-binding protein [Candidatus Korarchaeota archaeon]